MPPTRHRRYRAVTIAVMIPACLAVTAAGAAAVPGKAGDAARINVMTDADAKGDGIADDTKSVQQAIDKAHATGKPAYFPAGVYKITRDLDWSKPASLTGDPQAPAILSSPESKALMDDNASWPEAPKVDNLVFDGLRLDVRGESKRGPVVTRSVFVSRGEPAPGDPSEPQQTVREQTSIRLGYLRDAKVSDSVFLSARSKDGGQALFTYKTKGATFKRNVVGLDLADTRWLSRWPGGKSWTQKPHDRLTHIKSKGKLPGALGHFQRAMNLVRDKGTTVTGNVLNRDPRSRAKSDHSVYAGGFSDLRVSENWVRGWPQDASGGLKVRNGKKATVAGNYLDGTALLTYTYQASITPYAFKNVVICANVYDVRNVRPNSGAHNGIMYYRNFKGSGIEGSIAIFRNRFYDPRRLTDISQKKGAKPAFKAWNNKHADGSRVKTVDMRKGKPTAGQRARCKGAEAPKFSVPAYSS